MHKRHPLSLSIASRLNGLTHNMLHQHFLFLFLLPFAPPAFSKCYPPGPAFPIPDLTAVPSATINLTHGGAFWQHSTTSYSVQIVSSLSTLFESHHTAEFLGNYTDSPPTAVTRDTLFRIASNTKAFTVLAVMLTEGMDLDDGILEYVPELARGSGGVRWDEITLRALGGHMGGIVRDCMFLPNLLYLLVISLIARTLLCGGYLPDCPNNL